jgi:redox-sensitive bicupin YhaK (pirin superfamily)
MNTPRTIRKVFKSKPTIEGAGVYLKRAFGFSQVPLLDPFLLLDDFRSNNPADYLKGFPWHPHRGIDTITYMLEGNVEHGDSMGNRGIISVGAVQWMTAGSGIIHQEMPFGNERGGMGGFQLWANLPASQKMSHPRYRDITAAQIPKLQLENGVEIHIICGNIGPTNGPVNDIAIDPLYLDITVPPGISYTHHLNKGYTAFAYIISGKGLFCHQDKPFSYETDEVSYFDMESDPFLDNETLVLFNDGDTITVSTEDHHIRFLLISGKPLNEPIAWHGPIVMNTQAELARAFEEYQNGTFLQQSI